MSDTPATLADSLKKLAPDVIANQVKTIAEGMGGQASDAVKLNPQDELAAWMRATATPEQVAAMIEGGASDEEILQAARKYRHALGKAAGKGDPKKEVEYHEKQAGKAARYLDAINSGAPHDEAMRLAMQSKPLTREVQSI